MMLHKLCVIWCLSVIAISVHCKPDEDNKSSVERPEDKVKREKPEVTEETWTGRWLPEHTTETVKKATTAVDLHDDKHGIKMGIPSESCDNGQGNLSIDWNLSPVNYTCYNPSHLFIPNQELSALLETETVPEVYVSAHICVESPIVYDRPLPTFGDHRPLWPKYGEYKFLPIQRWLHNIEHGAVVMLYHPCANPVEVNRLRKIVVSCLRRHIITPYTLVEEQRPLVLIAWGVRLTMSTVDPDVVRAFLRQKSKHGLEGSDSRDGQYDFLLEVPSKIPSGSDIDDSVVCPYQ